MDSGIFFFSQLFTIECRNKTVFFFFLHVHNISSGDALVSVDYQSLSLVEQTNNLSNTCSVI